MGVANATDLYNAPGRMHIDDAVLNYRVFQFHLNTISQLNVYKDTNLIDLDFHMTDSPKYMSMCKLCFQTNSECSKASEILCSPHQWHGTAHK